MKPYKTLTAGLATVALIGCGPEEPTPADYTCAHPVIHVYEPVPSSVRGVELQLRDENCDGKVDWIQTTGTKRVLFTREDATYTPASVLQDAEKRGVPTMGPELERIVDRMVVDARAFAQTVDTFDYEAHKNREE